MFLKYESQLKFILIYTSIDIDIITHQNDHHYIPICQKDCMLELEIEITIALSHLLQYILTLVLIFSGIQTGNRGAEIMQ